MITALVLAAGESKRMGTVNKLLLPLGDTTLINHVVGTVQRSAAAEVVVVLGHEAEQVRAALAAQPVSFVYNSHYREGMTTSIQAGVAAASPEAEGFMICLSDLPRIRVADLNQVMAAFAQAAALHEAPIIVPVYEGQRGNPVLFSAAYRPALLAHTEPHGCKTLLTQHHEAVVEVTMSANHVLRDVDTMAAYHQMVAEREA